MLRTSSYNHAVASSRRLLDDLLRDFDNALGIEHLHRSAPAAFITSTRKGFEQTVIKRVSPLFTLCNSGSFAKGQTGDLLGQKLVPKLPAQSAANFSAIAAAPEPYSRSIVKILIISPSATRLPAVGLDTQKVFCVHSIRPHPGQAPHWNFCDQDGLGNPTKSRSCNSRNSNGTFSCAEYGERSD